MTDAAHLYFRYLAVSIRAQMQYRLSFAMLTLGHLLTTGIEFYAIVFLFQRFGSLRGWSLPEVAVLYGIVSVGFALAEGSGRGFDTFANLVKTGDFDRLLLRPRSTLLQVAGQELQLMRVGRLLQGCAVLVWACTRLNLFARPTALLLIAEAAAGAACLFYALFVLQAVVAFWTIENLEIWNAITYGGTEAGEYPMTIYRPWFRGVFTFVIPLACFNYIPAAHILSRPELDYIPAVLSYIAPLVGVAALLVSLQCWRLGVRHYRSTGS